MKPITNEEILTAWSNTDFKTGVYIHSPFCKEQCSYCTFKGTMFEKNAFHRYYSEYLPNQIKFYEPVLSSDLIRNFFWGGGTPTLMSPKIMRNIFNLIPNFKDCPKMDVSTRKILNDFFKPYNEKLFELLGKRFNWNDE